MPEPAKSDRLLLSGLPDHIAAVAASPGGESPRDRRGRLKARLVDLVPASAPANEEPGLSVADTQWLLGGGTRQWNSVINRFGQDHACDIAFRLVRHGVVTLRCTVTDNLALGPPIRWKLTQAWASRAASLREERLSRNTAWRERALAAAEAASSLDPAIAAVLATAKGHEPRLPVLVYAAEDLARGRVHDGPRAFSQTHFSHTKERDDVAEILRRAGAHEDTLTALGIARSGYIGLGGPVMLPHCDLSKLRGPVQLRIDDPALRGAVVRSSASTLLVVENLQAAESACDRHPDVVVVHTAGQPGDNALLLVTRLGTAISRAIIIPDADLGGLRIATRVLAALSAHIPRTLVDIGVQPHREREPFGPVSVHGLEALACGNDEVAAFAGACLGRGYPVEQEASTLAAITDALQRADTGT